MVSERQQERTHPEVIDLISDDSEDDREHTPSEPTQFLNDEEEVHDDPPEDRPAPLPPQGGAEPGRRGTVVNVAGEDIFIPDEEDPFYAPRVATAATHNDHEYALALDDQNQVYAVEQCLQQVLEIFKDIDHDHVRKLYTEFDSKEGYESISGPARFDNIIEQLLSASSYPKQPKGKGALKKRKREDSTTETINDRWERPERETVPRTFLYVTRAMLKAEFPEIPHQFIQNMLTTHVHLYQTYIALADARYSYDPARPAYGKGRVNGLADALTMATSSGFPALVDELQAARTRAAIIKSQRAAEQAQKLAEQANLEEAKERGETAECSVCYDDLPMNRMIHCDGNVPHFTCYDCMHTYIKTEVGESRCKVLCTAGCGSGFTYRQLQLLADKQLLEKLAEIEQEQAIRNAGLDDLEECPFCDYKVILPPVEEDFEFRCANPECEKVSCRRCKAISHIPLSCEQHAKDNKINTRHKVEEAMTAALIRQCNKCKKQFIKDFGCNKMTCSSCGNTQCYVCSKSTTDYNHFDQSAQPGRTQNAQTSTKCPLYDNVEERHEREVKEAEAAARAAVIEENPDVDAADLEIKVSDAVKDATNARIHRAGPHRMGGYFPVAGLAGQYLPNIGFANADGNVHADLARLHDGAHDINERLARMNRRLDQMREIGDRPGQRVGRRRGAERIRERTEIIRERTAAVRERADAMQRRRQPGLPARPPQPPPSQFPAQQPMPLYGPPLQMPFEAWHDFAQPRRDAVPGAAAPLAPLHRPIVERHRDEDLFRDRLAYGAARHDVGAPLPVHYAPPRDDYDPFNYLLHDPFGNDGAADANANEQPRLQAYHNGGNNLERPHATVAANGDPEVQAQVDRLNEIERQQAARGPRHCVRQNQPFPDPQPARQPIHHPVRVLLPGHALQGAPFDPPAQAGEQAGQDRQPQQAWLNRQLTQQQLLQRRVAMMQQRAGAERDGNAILERIRQGERQRELGQ